MKKFIVKSVLFLSLLTVIITGFSGSYKSSYNLDTDYMAAIINKHEYLKHTGNNRLILAGGSSMAFGVNSEFLEKELNTKVVNLALQAGLGSEFIMNEVASVVIKGDIVLLGLEYQLYDDDNKPNIDLIYHTQGLYEPARAYYKLNLADLTLINIQKFRKYFQPKSEKVSEVYNRKAFNRCGDVIGHLKSPGRYTGGNVTLNIVSIDKTLTGIKTLHEKCKKAGASLYIIFPCYPSTDFAKHRKTTEKIKNEIAVYLPEIKVLNTPETFVFEDRYFFDTEYHLTADGRDQMTSKLETILKDQVFNENTIGLKVVDPHVK
ncbi:MAG TPA: hypothetical protein VHO90_09305 [Bacteroidales bacterium]|nr:hypothetical protein [Bacteroidales bacterium]